MTVSEAIKIPTPEEELWGFINEAAAKDWGPKQWDYLCTQYSSAQVFAAAVKGVLDTGINKMWNDPRPLDDELLPVPVFEERFLPIGIRPYVVNIAKRNSVKLDFPAPCALTTIAGVLGRRVMIFPKKKNKRWVETIALSGITVALSGTLKTPTFKELTSIVYVLNREAREQHDRAMAQYQSDCEAWEARKKASKGAAFEEPRPKEPPPCRCFVINDATPEACHQTMSENPEGILLDRDEGGGWISQMHQQGREADLNLWLKAQNGNDFYELQRILRGKVNAIMCASVFCGFQPTLFRKFLTDTELESVSSGLVPRFAFLIWPDEEQRFEADVEVDEAGEGRYRAMIRSFATLRAECIYMHFTAEAQDIFDAWIVKLNKKTWEENKKGNKEMYSHFSKYRGWLPKIAGEFQLIDLATLGAPGETQYLPGIDLERTEVAQGPLWGTPEKHQTVYIDREHLEMAIDLMDNYLELHARRCYGCNRTFVQSAEAVLGKHLKDGDLSSSFTAREVFRKGWIGLKSLDLLEAALANLRDKGWVRSYLDKVNGQFVMRWDINPKVLAVQIGKAA
jgi:hypothetical protein